jgi:hypothetical protein
MTTTKDEIIEMARQANFYHSEYAKSYAANIEDIEAFAKLVEERTAAKEREACAKMCDATEGAEGKDLAKAIRARAQAERGEA